MKLGLCMCWSGCYFLGTPAADIDICVVEIRAASELKDRLIRKVMYFLGVSHQR